MSYSKIHQYIDHYIDKTPVYLVPISKGKKPLTKHGVKNATRSKPALKAMANVHPEMNLGFRTGENFIYVVDLDVPKTESSKGLSGEESLQKHFGKEFIFDHEKYLCATTPSGGKHYFFKGDPNHPLTSKIGVLERVDIKGDGGYVLVEPSKITQPSGKVGEYKFNNINNPISPLLPWVIELIKKPTTRPIGSTNSDMDYKEIISGISQGKREQSIFTIACSMRKQGITQDIATSFIKVVAERCQPPFPTREAELKIKRAYSIKLPNIKIGDQS